MYLSLQIDSSLAPRQFTIKPQSSTAGDEVRVHAHPDIGVFDILENSGTRIGLVLGFPIDLQERRVLSGPLKVAHPISSGIDQIAEQILDRLGGRFLFLLVVSGEGRIYPDCAAQVPCVYSVEKGIAGSTADAILSNDEYERMFCHDLYSKLDVENDGWFPGGLTAHKGIERLLPNHVLNLRDWSQKRYWPLENIARTESPESSLEEISQIIRIQLEALLNGPRRVAQALTAGHETRVMLACARPYLDAIDFVTLEGDTPRADDTVISRRIAHDLGLTHRMLPRVMADETAVARYMRRGGHCVGGPNKFFHPTLGHLANDYDFVGGLNGEIGRAFLWREVDTAQTNLSAETLTSRMGLPSLLEIQERFVSWREALPTTDPLLELDLAYLEHRMGPWSSAQFFSDPSLVRHNPIGTTKTVKLMLGLPDAWKRQSMLTTGIIQMHWPELMSYPFNSQGAMRDLLKQLGRAARRPQLIVQKLRKMRR